MTELHALGFVIFLSTIYVTCHMKIESSGIMFLCRMVAVAGLFMVLLVLWPK